MTRTQNHGALFPLQMWVLTKDERNELFEWIVKVNLKFSRGLAMDFKDGSYLAATIAHYLSSSFVQSSIVASLAPSKCLKNWELLRDTELKALGITVNDVQPYATGKNDDSGRPCVESLLWEVKNAIENYKPATAAKASRWIRPATVNKRDQKPSSYVEEVTAPKPASNSRTEIESQGTSKAVASKVQSKTGTIKKPSGFKTFVDKLDGTDDGKFFGIDLAKKATVKPPLYSELQAKVVELTALVQKQDLEIKELRKSLGIPPVSAVKATAVPGQKQLAKPVEKEAKRELSKVGPKELVVASMTYIEDQKEEMKGKCWINFKLSDGKQYSAFYDEKTTDVQIHKGAHKHTDAIETLEFETDISPLPW